MEKYGIDMVVANELKTRRNQVVIYKKDKSSESLKVEEPLFEEEISQLIVEHIRQYLSLNTAIEIVEFVDQDTDVGVSATKHKTYERELFVSSISFSTTEESLRQHFEAYGDLVKVKIIKRNGKSAGKAFVAYTEESAAENAVKALDGTELDGRQLNVQLQGEFKSNPPTINRPQREREPYAQSKSSRYYDDDRYYDDRDHRDQEVYHGKRRNQDRYPVQNVRSKVLYIGNLNFDSEEQDIDKFFRGYGQINDIRIK